MTGDIPELLAEVSFTARSGRRAFKSTGGAGAHNFPKSANRRCGDGARASESVNWSLLAIAAKAVEVDDGDPAIFKLQETFLLQPLQALIGVLPGDA